MKKVNKWLLGLTFATTAMSLSAPAFAEKTMRVGSWLPPKHTMNKDVIPTWGKWIEEATEGRVKLKIEYPGGHPKALLDNVQDGVFDAGWTFHGYFPGRFKLTKIVELPNLGADAEAAYERGKEAYYTQRGYLKLSCATCHVQGTGQRVRNESMSQLLGHTTHFPVFRLKWGKDKVANGLGTLERRMTGCNKDQGENPHKAGSKWMKELLYFMAYMSNGMNVDGPDVRK